MINYRSGKTKYQPNSLGSLYVDESSLSSSSPVIYIGGQMEHRNHVLEKTGFTFDKAHNMFNGSWFYDYKIAGIDKSTCNAINFCDNLITSLKEAKLENVTLITESFGGMIAAYATKSNLVSKAITIHSPLLGTPLANPSIFDNKELSYYQRLLVQALKFLVDERYGFQTDNSKGLDLSRVDLNKLLVVGSSLDLSKEKNPLLKETYRLIEMATGFQSDGVVIFEPGIFEYYGINYYQEEDNVNHFVANSAPHIEKISKKLLKP